MVEKITDDKLSSYLQKVGKPELIAWLMARCREDEKLRASLLDLVAPKEEGKGFDVQKEVPVGGGKTIDVVASRNGRTTSLGIETGKSHASANVNKCIKAGFEEIAVVTASARVRDRLRLTLPGHAGVSIRTASELLRGK
jgi:hypothetical protein